MTIIADPLRSRSDSWQGPSTEKGPTMRRCRSCSCPSGDASQVAKIGTLGEAVVVLAATETTLLEADQVVAHVVPLCLFGFEFCHQFRTSSDRLFVVARLQAKLIALPEEAVALQIPEIRNVLVDAADDGIGVGLEHLGDSLLRCLYYAASRWLCQLLYGIPIEYLCLHWIFFFEFIIVI